MRAFLLVLALTACKPAPPVVAVAAKPIHPDLVCPGGTIQAGKAPPLGAEVWCHQSLPNGTWIRHGAVIGFFSNEQRAFTGEYQNGKKSGNWQFFYPTGQLEKQGPYAGGVENGLWTSFHPSGDRRSEGDMVDGKEHGPWSYWMEDGSWTAGSWNLGARDGVWIEHDINGKPRSEREYKAGRMIAMREL